MSIEALEDEDEKNLLEISVKRQRQKSRIGKERKETLRSNLNNMREDRVG